MSSQSNCIHGKIADTCPSCCIHGKNSDKCFSCHVHNYITSKIRSGFSCRHGNSFDSCYSCRVERLDQVRREVERIAREEYDREFRTCKRHYRLDCDTCWRAAHPTCSHGNIVQFCSHCSTFIE